MVILSGAIVPLFVVAFILLAFQYYRLSPERRLWNLHFILAISAILLMFIYVFTHHDPADSFSLLFLLLALIWVGIAVWLLRKLLQ